MANPYKSYYQSKANIKNIDRESRARYGAISEGLSLGATVKGEGDIVRTAWDEYEAGIGELDGEYEKPGFFKRLQQHAQHWLPGGKTGLPGGETRIGDVMYQGKNIQRLGGLIRALDDPESVSGKRLAEGVVSGRYKTLEEGRGRVVKDLRKFAPGKYVQGVDPTMDYSSLAGSGVSPEDYDKLVSSRQKSYSDWEEAMEPLKDPLEIQQTNYLRPVDIKKETRSPLQKITSFFQRKKDVKDVEKWRTGSDPTMDYSSLADWHEGADIAGALSSGKGEEVTLGESYDQLVRDRQQGYKRQQVEGLDQTILSDPRISKPDMSQYEPQQMAQRQVVSPQAIDQGEPPLYAMSSEERERYRYENAMRESRTFSPRYDFVRPVGERAYDLRQSSLLRSRLFDR